MSKYSEEFKLKVVNYYFNNNCGWEHVANKFNIPAFVNDKIRMYKKWNLKMYKNVQIKIP